MVAIEGVCNRSGYAIGRADVFNVSIVVMDIVRSVASNKQPLRPYLNGVTNELYVHRGDALGRCLIGDLYQRVWVERSAGSIPCLPIDLAVDEDDLRGLPRHLDQVRGVRLRRPVAKELIEGEVLVR